MHHIGATASLRTMWVRFGYGSIFCRLTASYEKNDRAMMGNMLH